MSEQLKNRIEAMGLVLPPAPKPAGVYKPILIIDNQLYVSGQGPVLNDGGLIDKVHAICLSGGSVYGLAAADGVCAWLGEKRLGYEVGPSPIPVSPIVPSAILFDNANGGDKNWGITPPFRNLGVLACESASKQMDLGKIGAGYGAMSGIYNGGVGSASEVCKEFTVGAIIAANSVGSPYMNFKFMIFVSNRGANIHKSNSQNNACSNIFK